jgi:hypothetical protein
VYFPFGLEVQNGEWGAFHDRWASVYGDNIVWLGCDTDNIECRLCYRRWPVRDGCWDKGKKRWEGKDEHDVEFVKRMCNREESKKKVNLSSCIAYNRMGLTSSCGHISSFSPNLQ